MTIGTTTPRAGEATDWKARYRQASEALEALQRASSDNENALFKAVLRLAFSFAGQDAQFDARLSELRGALRRGADAGERRERIQAMLAAIAELHEGMQAAHHRAAAAALVELLDALPAAAQDIETRQLRERVLRPHEPMPAPAAMRALAARLREAGDGHEAESELLERLLSGLRLGGEAGLQLIDLRARQRGCRERGEQLALADAALALIHRALDERPAGKLGTATVSTAELAAVVLELIDWLSLPKTVEQALADVKEALRDGELDRDALTAVLKRLAALVVDLQAGLQAEITAAETFLIDLGSRLDGLAERLACAAGAGGEALAASRALHQDLHAELERLGRDAGELSDGAALRALVEARADRLGARLDAYLDGEQARCMERRAALEALQPGLRALGAEAAALRGSMAAGRAEALTDALTGLPNRRALHEHLDGLLAGGPQAPAPLTLAVLDLDHFKQVNARHGRAVGDKVLIHVARQCRAALPGAAFLARLGGEELAAVLPACDLQAGCGILERVRSELARIRFHRGGEPVPVTVSIGLAERARGEAAGTLLGRAEAAVAAAKRAGRNRVTPAPAGCAPA